MLENMKISKMFYLKKKKKFFFFFLKYSFPLKKKDISKRPRTKFEAMQREMAKCFKSLRKKGKLNTERG